MEEEILPKGKKYSLKMLNSVEEYTYLVSGQWAVDKKTNAFVLSLLHNYKIKENDLQGMLRREKFTIAVGDELAPRNFKISKSIHS